MSEPGAKNDGGKDRWDLLPIAPIREVVRVLTKGAEKYAPDGWKLVERPRSRYYAAAMRHITDWAEGEQNDREWGFHHLAHAICCLSFAMWFDLTEASRPPGGLAREDK